MLETLKEKLALLHLELPKNDLVRWTVGYISARDSETGVVANFMRTHLLSVLAAVVNVPVSVMSTAGGGGAWGMALLAAYMLQSREDLPLEAYLSQEVFLSEEAITLQPDPADVAGFSAFMERYKKGFKIERIAVEVL